MTQKARLLSGRIQVTAPTAVTSDRYQFLGLEQAEPNLGVSSSGNVLTTDTSGNRIWTNQLSLANVTVTSGFRGNIFADTITPYQTAVTIFNSSTAVKLPVGDNSSRPTGSAGYLRFNTAGLAPEYYNGTDWVSVNNTIVDQNFNGDGVNATYTLSQPASQAGILVSINGTLQQPGTAYTVSGDQLTFAEIPLTTDAIDVRFLGALVTMSPLVDSLIVSGNITAANVQITTGGFVKYPVYTAANLIVITGQVGWVAAVSNSTPGGSLAFWDTTNSRWSYVSSGSAV